ncbi:2Fe-2S iron-sulfur cluster-binding protein [Gloeothece verrucosa]|uniref:Ferredoxin (2Fe-2S) n=1 Tax=Gloeothece verrucosa (strain PCC 7822) TaxID=497965 RepID=E0U598_GLOV7|nr:2Fe-2S iron-sulfur cluster-binding protein [Gloeothece verrucosa]ADN12377.1 ferredoxin (2Fe-2S) [Gloeothece verrucosa PCC 7822]
MSSITKSEETFTVTLINDKKEINKKILVREDEFILDVAEQKEIKLPYSCRAGACFDCLGKVISGKVEQTEKALEFLKPDELKAGYILLCAASPRSDCVIQTHQVEELFGED